MEGLHRFTVGEGQRALRREIIHAGSTDEAAGRAVRHVDRGVIHRHRARAADGARHRDRREAGGLEHGQRVGRETKRPFAAIIVDDDQCGVREPTGEREAGRRIRDGQTERDRLVTLDEQVVNNRHRERRAGLAVGELHRRGYLREIRALRRSAVGAGEDIDREIFHQAARAQHRDERAAGALDHVVNRGAEAHEAVIFLDQNRRARDRIERHAAEGVRQIQQDRAIRGNEFVVDQTDRERRGGLAFREDENVRGQREIIRVRNRRAADDVHRRVDLIRGAARARHDDDGVRSTLAHLIQRRAEGQRAAAEIRAAEEPREMVVSRAVEPRERAAQENLPIGLHRQRRDEIVRAGAEVERRVERAVRIQPREAAAADAIHARERAAEDDLAVRLQGERRDGIIRARASVEAGVERTIGIQAHHAADVRLQQRATRRGEIAADQNFSIVLNRHRINGAGGGNPERHKRGVE